MANRAAFNCNTYCKCFGSQLVPFSTQIVYTKRLTSNYAMTLKNEHTRIDGLATNKPKQRHIQKFQRGGGGAIQKPRQLKLIDGTSFFACVRLCMASPPYLRVSLHSGIQCFDFLNIGVARRSVVFCPMLQFKLTLQFIYFGVHSPCHKTRQNKTHASNQVTPI